MTGAPWQGARTSLPVFQSSRATELRLHEGKPGPQDQLHNATNKMWQGGWVTSTNASSYRPAPRSPPTPPCAVRHWYWKLWVGAPSLSLRLATNKTGSCPEADGDAAKLRKTLRVAGGGRGREAGRELRVTQQILSAAVGARSSRDSEGERDGAATEGCLRL